MGLEKTDSLYNLKLREYLYIFRKHACVVVLSRKKYLSEKEVMRSKLGKKIFCSNWNVWGYWHHP